MRRCCMENIPPKVMCKSCEMNFSPFSMFLTIKMYSTRGSSFIVSIDGVPQVFSIIKLFMLLKVVILSRDWRTECFKCLIVIEFSVLFYHLIDGAMELSFMRFLQ